jgi:LacI family transcriptional regulator
VKVDPAALTSVRLDAGSARPLYAQVADFLSELVRRDFEDGGLFFTDKVLVDRLPVSQVTIRRAMRELANQGLIERTRRRGTVVRKHRRTGTPAVSAAPVAAAQASFRSGLGPRAEKALRAVGIFRPAQMLPFSEHASSLMQEFQRQCEARSLECRYYDASSADSMLRSFGQISSQPEEEAFVLHTTLDATLMLYHSLSNRGFRTVAMEGAASTYPGWIVETDAAEAARIGVKHLRGLGHERIVLLVNEPDVEPTVIDKINAFKDIALAERIWDSCRVVICNAGYTNSYEAAFNHMDDAIGADPRTRPTAILAVSDPGAWAALKWCSQNGISVPNDISVLGFEDAMSSKYMIPAVSSIAHPRPQLVGTILDLLVGEMTGPARRILVPPVLVSRESTGPVGAVSPLIQDRARRARPSLQDVALVS